MNLKEIKVPVILGVFVLTLIIAIGAQKMLHQQRVIKPFETSLMEIQGVDQVQVTEKDNGVDVMLDVSQVESLADLVAEAHRVASEFSVEMTLTLQDQANEELINTYHQMHFALEEGVFLGNFQQMSEQVAKLATLHGVEHQLSLDRDFVYLSLAQQGQELHAVVSRTDNQQVRVVRGEEG